MKRTDWSEENVEGTSSDIHIVFIVYQFVHLGQIIGGGEGLLLERKLRQV